MRREPLAVVCPLAALTLSGVLAAQDPPRHVEGALGERIAEFTNRMAAFGFGGAVLAARDGKVVAALGTGFADLDGERPVTANTLFETASITKQFTAAAILVLVQQGRLQLDDPIDRHLPDVPADCQKITVRHLLQHTSGIPGTNSRGGGNDLPAVLATFLAGGPRHEPGTHFEYWNQGYALLAAIVERHGGGSYTDFCRRELFAPAGMRGACFTGDPAPDGFDAAIGTSSQGAPRSALEHPYGSYGYQYRGMGGAVCTVWDLWRWDGALRTEQVLRAAAKRELFAPGPGGYALGWFVGEENGRKVQRHGGGVRGFVGELRRWPEQDAMLCVLSHRTDAPLGEVVRGIEAILFGGTADTPVPMPIAVGRELVGTWTLGGRRLVIREQGDALHAALHWSEAGPVTRGVLVGAELAELAFFDWSARTPLRIERGDDDKVRALVLEKLVFERQ